jgi:hypothetical protein
MVIENVLLAVESAESLIVTLPFEKVPVCVGVPVKPMVLPLSVAVRPVGNPDVLLIVYGLVPPVIVIVPSNPG